MLCLYICILCLIVDFTHTIVLEQGSKCLTPNGENGTCISINDCRVIEQALVYLDDDAIAFAKKSLCGYDDAAMVCCGSVSYALSIAEITKSRPAGVTQTTPAASILSPALPPPAQPIENSFLPDPSLCGLQINQDKIVGGTQTGIGEFPWMVALKYTKNDGTPGGFRCSGTLINNKYILTAAQCLDIPGYNLTEVRLGEWKFSTTNDCVLETDDLNICADPALDLPIVQKIPHAFYSKRRGNNDIALLRVEKNIKYTEYARPICLPPSGYSVPPIRTIMYISGWGITENGSQSDVKLKVPVPMAGREECSKAYPNYTTIFTNQACAGGEEGRGACSGDSGSPLMRTYEQDELDEEVQWFQEGIIHKGFGCGRKNIPGLYTRVSRYVNWIVKKIVENS